MSTTDPDIAIIETSSLGDRSYLISHDGIAVVIDPQRDIDRVRALAAEKNAVITHVLETHIHNDYVTGGLELARATGAEYVVPDGDPVNSVGRDKRREHDESGVLEESTNLADPPHIFRSILWGETEVAV